MSQFAGMEIKIRNCNNLDNAEIEVTEGKVNVKYGPNGTGKTTIARAVALGSQVPPADLSGLLPFKYRGANLLQEQKPFVSCSKHFTKIMLFNEEYVNNIVLRQDEVLKDSFNIFIRTSDYEARMSEIEKLILRIRKTFAENAELGQVIKDLYDLIDSFGKTKSKTGYVKSSRIARGIGGGNKLEHIPEHLKAYAPHLKGENNVKWIKWQIDGNEFLPTASSCPFCTAPTDAVKITMIESIKNEYDPKSIEHLNLLIGVVDRLGKYFSPDTLNSITTLINNKDGITKDGEEFLGGILRNQIELLHRKLIDVQTISFFSLRDVGEVEDKLLALKIDPTNILSLNSSATLDVITIVNQAIDDVLVSVSKLQGEVNKHKAKIEAVIAMRKGEINDFLQYAGYKYSVDIPPDRDSYKMRLRHCDFAEDIEHGSNHLSFGERNAFALVLFMYECLSVNAELIVLDDPISSFDKSKKFAILHMLFKGSPTTCLRGKTALLLTHDIEPVIDMIKAVPKFFAECTTASFLKNTAGSISEIPIRQIDIATFSDICRENLSSPTEDVIKTIYLRRNFETISGKCLKYNMLASLLHGKEAPTVQSKDGTAPMTAEESAYAITSIKKWFDDFSYAAILSTVLDKEKLRQLYDANTNNYEKLQLFRMMNVSEVEHGVLRKYINETYHIENEYIMQLNPRKYDHVPDFIIDECSKLLLL